MTNQKTSSLATAQRETMKDSIGSEDESMML
jgi:hypothetical protein